MNLYYLTIRRKRGFWEVRWRGKGWHICGGRSLASTVIRAIKCRYSTLWKAICVARAGKYKEIKRIPDCYGIVRWHPESIQSFQEYLRARALLYEYPLLTQTLSILGII